MVEMDCMFQLEKNYAQNYIVIGILIFATESVYIMHAPVKQFEFPLTKSLT